MYDMDQCLCGLVPAGKPSSLHACQQIFSHSETASGHPKVTLPTGIRVVAV